MLEFESNIQNMYGEKGKAWLQDLPKRITELTATLGLRDLTPLSRLSHHFILSGFQGNVPVILKLGFDKEALKKEASALRCFSGCGAVDVIVEGNDFLLLQCAVPGISLKSYFPTQDKAAIEIVCTVMQKLHQARIPKDHDFPHIKDWLALLDHDWNIPSVYLQKSRMLRDMLLVTSDLDVLLHGDLHHENILQDHQHPYGIKDEGHQWVVVDPKGVIGPASMEFAAFICNPIPNLLKQANAIEMIQNRIIGFSKTLHTPVVQIIHWCFVKAVLSWIWALEDNTDPLYWAALVKIFDEL